MKQKTNFSYATTLVAFATLVTSSYAVDRIKQNNTTDLNLAGSWDTLPTSSDVAVWNNTVSAANTVNLGGNLDWAGIKISNPGGLVTIRHAAGQTLTLGASGIDMSSAMQNLTLLSAVTANTASTVSISADQSWNIATGRTLTLFSTSNSANQRLSGSGNISVSGGGVVNLNVGDAGSTTFTAGNGNDTYTGNWTISGGSKVVSLRNGTHAWGKGTITLDNGTLSQNTGNWSFSNNISVASGGGAIYSDSSGSNRYMNLTGVISGSGALGFNSIAAMTGQEGFILTGANTFTGAMTINANATVRIGGDATTSMNSTAAGTLGSIVSTVAITNNGILGFGRTDAHTFANSISGTGIVRLGRVGGALPTTQVVTMSGASTYTGATQVNAGRLHLTGSLTSAITVASGASISGNGSSTGLLTLSSGSGIALSGGATTTSISINGVTFSGSNLVTFLSNPTASTVYDVFSYGSGPVTTPGNLSVAWRGTLTDDVSNQKYIFTAGASGTRTWNTTTSTWAQGAVGNWIEGDQSFYGGDSVIFNEPASASSVTLSGRLAPASVFVNNTTNAYTFSGVDGTADITGAATLTKTNGGTLILNSAHSYTGTTTVSGGIIDVGNGGTSGSLGSGAVSVAAGAEVAFNRSNAFTVSNVLSGDGLITKKGAGRMTVNGNNSGAAIHWNFRGTGNGDIGFQNSNAIGGTSSTIALENNATGSVFLATNGNTTDVGISLGSGSILTWNGSTGNTTTLTGVISGSGAITKVSGEVIRLTGDNTYTGNTTITTGVVEIVGVGQLGSGNYAGDISNAATLTFNTSANQILSGVISGSGVLNQSGVSTLTLSGTSTYTGATNVSAGTLLVTGALGNSAVGVSNAGTAFGGSGSLAGSLTLNVGTIFYVADLSDPLLVTGSVSLYSDFGVDDLAGLTWSSVNNGTYTLIGGTLGAGVFDSLAHNSLGSAYDIGGGRSAYFQQGSLQLVVIPESSTALLGGLGLLAMLRRRRVMA
jgi:autotransporter-associated beta strand protein